jgi:predicted nuclease with TOPRIM domain
MTEKAKADIDESKDAIDEMEKELADLARDIENAIDDIEDRWGEIAGEVDEIPISPYKKDVLIDLFGVAWMPYHLVEVEGRFEELPGFEV